MIKKNVGMITLSDNIRDFIYKVKKFIFKSVF